MQKKSDIGYFQVSGEMYRNPYADRIAHPLDLILSVVILQAMLPLFD